MSTGPTTLPKKGPQERAARRRLLPRLRDARIRSKLALILVVPVAAVLALATVRLLDVGREAYQADLIRSLTSLSTDISALTQDIHQERMAAVNLLAARSSKPDTYHLHVRRTDDRIAAYNADRRKLGDVPAAVRERLRAIDDHLTTLNTTRQEVLDRKQMPVSEAVLRYGVVLADLVSYGDALGQVSGEGAVAESLRAVAAFARAKAATAEQQSVAFTALSGNRLEEEQFSAFVATLTSQQEALLAFSLAASPRERALVEKSVSGDAVVLADRVAADVSRSVGVRPLVSAVDAAAAVGAVTDLMRWAEVELEAHLLDQADQARAAVVQQAIIESSMVLVTLIVAIVLAVMLARSLNQSLRRLREGALSVAHHDLPEAVNRLRDVSNIEEGSVEEIVRQVRDPIRLSNRDEIGQVASAFNVVHKEAVRIAAEQAALRTSVSAMFLNLARRSQTLVDRMIGELDMIERGEEDPKRLAQLFELDHLATRMRRNDENLLVLAGADSTAPRRDDALLVDALRAAQSEVEQYNRIEFGTVDTDISIAAHAVNDVVRLVAELLDNATRFSPPTTAVVADARRIRDYVLVQVEDRGLGLSDEQLDSLNRRLAAPPAVDVAAFRLMGLAVVSRLASRYSIRVELRRNVEGGTVAQVTLPSNTVVLPKPQGREQILGRPRQPLAVEPGPSAAAAAIGGGSWSEPAGAAAGTRGAPAAFAEPQRGTPPMQWQTAADSRGLGAPVAAAAWPSAQQPAAPQNMAHQVIAPAAPLLPPAVATGIGTPTVSYPTVGAPPQYGTSDAGPGQPSAYTMTPATAPVAGLPNGPVAGAAATGAAAPAPRPEDVGEMPIFREMEAVWFRSHGQDTTAIFTVPADGYQSPPPPAGSPATQPIARGGGSAPAAGAGTVRPPLPTRPTGASLPPSMPAASPPPAPYTPPSAPEPAPAPQPRTAAGGQAWQTAADEGWARANRAAAPATAGSTRSGLPKRVPQAQLVPGGVETKSNRERTRRTPDEVRGLLSAYHRGVQRGRTAGVEQNGSTSTKETSE